MSAVQPVKDPGQVEAMALACRRVSERNYVMWKLGTNTGLRISDQLKLRVKDVKGEHIIIKEQKTGKRNRLLINPKLRKVLDQYIAGKNDRVYLFRSRVGTNRPLSRSAAYNLLRKAADEVGLAEVGTHTMRKTFGYFFYAKTHNIAVLQRIFNHSKPLTTLIYIGVEQEAIDDEMRAFSV